MTQLKRLTDAEALVDYKLGDDAEPIPEDELERYTTPIEGVTADIDGLRDALEDVMDEYDEKYDEDMSFDAAVAVREHLDISRRYASVPELWHWLAICQFPEFVRHRWRPEDDLDEKFREAGTDIYSNALHRLWWMAELTRDEDTDDPYERTERVLCERGQQFANRIFDYWFARDETTTKAVVDVLIDVDFNDVDAVVQELRHRETRYRIETMSKSEIESLVEEILVDVRGSALVAGGG